MGNSVLFDGHDAAANPPLSLSASLAGSAWSIEAWVKLAQNYYHATDDLVIFSIGSKFKLYVECTTGDLKFSNGVTINDIPGNLIDGNRYHIVVTNDLTTSNVYVNSELVGTFTTAETIAGTDAIVICDFTGKGDNFAFYDKELTLAQVRVHYNSGICENIVHTDQPLKVYAAQGSVIFYSNDHTYPSLDGILKVYASQASIIIKEV